MRNPQWAADVAARCVELEDWARFPLLFQEVVVGVVGGIAVELIETTVILLLARLDYHDDGTARADAIVCCVVRTQCLEFADGILRRQVHEAAAATAVILLG